MTKAAKPAPAPDDAGHAPKVLSKSEYEKELERLQTELVRMQEWIIHEGQRVVVIFEGRDTAGKGGTIKRITERLNARFCRVVSVTQSNPAAAAAAAKSTRFAFRNV